MGTRSVTIFKNIQAKFVEDADGRISEDGFESVELFRMYRHWDGYPEGHGAEIANAVESADKLIKKGDCRADNRNWCQLLCAELFKSSASMEVEPHDVEHGDIEYLYVVEGEYANYGGKHGIAQLPVTISVYECGFDEKYSEVLEREPLFKGSASEYRAWLLK